VDALLQLVPAPLRAHVRATAERATSADKAWCRRLLGPSAEVLGPNVARTVACIAPTLPYDDVRLLIRLSIWFYLLDDRQDDPRAEPADLRELGRGVGAVLDGAAPATGDDVLLTALADLRDELAARCSGFALRRWTDSVREGLRAGVEHVLLGRLVVAGRAYPPTVEQYLEVAVRHINYGCFALALVLLLEPAPEPAQLDLLDGALLYGNLAVRLANDLRTHARESALGGLNVMNLAVWELAPVRGESVRARIANAAQTHDALLAALPAQLRGALSHSLQISVAVYEIGDLR
jgi:hypothetical protein